MREPIDRINLRVCLSGITIIAGSNLRQAVRGYGHENERKKITGYCFNESGKKCANI